MIQKILFATDLGVYTPYLLHHVNALASQYDARVLVLHAIEPPGHMGDAVVQTYLSREHKKELEQEGIERIIDGIRGNVLDVLEEEFIDGQHGLSRVRDVRVIPGKPAQVIMEQAEKNRVDLIVVGSHGQGTVSPNMLGSVTSKILQMSRVPVYMVPLIRKEFARASCSA